MANLVKFNVKNVPAALSEMYVRVTDTDRNELYSGVTNVSGSGVELDIGSAGTVGKGVLVYGDNYTAGNETTFKGFSGYGLIEQGEIPNTYNNSFMYMAASDSYVNNGSTNLITSVFKMQLPGNVDAVKVFVLVRGAADGFVVSVAPTETMDISTDDSRYYPIEGGLVNNDNWVTEILPASTSGSSEEPSTAISTWLNVKDIPRADSGENKAFIIKISGVTSGSYQKVNVNDEWALADGNSFFVPLPSETVAGDFATDPTSTMSGEMTNGWSHWYGVEYRTTDKVENVYAIGDSITSGGGGQLYGYDNWSNRAVFKMQNDGLKISVVNGGMSGKNSATYTQRFFDAIENGITPTIVTIPAFTPNDGNPTKESCDARFLLIESVIEKCKEIGAKVFLWTGLPVDGYGSDQWIVYSNDWAIQKDIDESIVTLIDFNLIASDGATPMRFKAGYSNDGIHPNDVLIQLMADELESKIISII